MFCPEGFNRRWVFKILFTFGFNFNFTFFFLMKKWVGSSRFLVPLNPLHTSPFFDDFYLLLISCENSGFKISNKAFGFATKKKNNYQK